MSEVTIRLKGEVVEIAKGDLCSPLCFITPNSSEVLMLQDGEVSNQRVLRVLQQQSSFFQKRDTIRQMIEQDWR